MYISVCLIFCNWATIIFTLFAIIMLHLQILQEERWYLEKRFGEEYLIYKKKYFDIWADDSKKADKTY